VVADGQFNDGVSKEGKARVGHPIPVAVFSARRRMRDGLDGQVTIPERVVKDFFQAIDHLIHDPA